MDIISRTKPAFRLRTFTTSRYLPSKNGRLEPLIPSACPESTLSERSACDIRGKGWRSRKCGPEFSLRVCFCGSHQGSFTIYPLGWVPYGRQTIDGLAKISDLAEKSFSFFSSAIDGKREKKWPVFATGLQKEDCPAVFKTQKRQLGVLEKLFCLSKIFTNEDRWKISDQIGVNTQALNDLAGGIRDGPTWVSRAKAVYSVLTSSYPQFKHDLASILKLGFTQGTWGNARISMI